ncbi:HAD family hydrolase [Formosa algae]|uniref:Hydrolase of the HAD superfamily n=1 Tax=Formosa algae TaxID=225843 RepID=A0A9X0YNH6_9FLAO|nr:HAD family phosphatase [Formosa algae]MBP1840231.1 putative hydrolase of the HAD superfamily [Formosa algae]MDQ0335831.1 putative hydrolase of the HAD superfamily [Formosa algae]OEI80956.1 haloacid dehalogenase [Formosa algae]PNW26155.1 haloacid dehalogenase [Formosa algae]
MIKTIIFDFGDVFINLDKVGALEQALLNFKLENIPEDMVHINSLYEMGLIDNSEFLEFYETSFPEITKDKIIEIWNSILKDFPHHRLEFLKSLSESKKYKLILLSNTNDLHIEFVKSYVPFFKEFESYFDVFYLSHEINLRKPNPDIYEFVLKENNLIASETLFVDDLKENTESAEKLGINTWNIIPGKEDVTTLFETKKELFS